MLDPDLRLPTIRMPCRYPRWTRLQARTPVSYLPAVAAGAALSRRCRRRSARRATPPRHRRRVVEHKTGVGVTEPVRVRAEDHDPAGRDRGHRHRAGTRLLQVHTLLDLPELA